MTDIDMPAEIHTPDGAVTRGRDTADARVNLEMRRHLERRALRGRDPMVAHILGFFEGEAAWQRGLDLEGIT